MRAVAADFSVDRAAIALQQASDLGLRECWRLLSQRRQRIPLLGSDLVISQRRTLSWRKDSSVSQIAPLRANCCCTYFLNSRRPNYCQKLARPGFGPALKRLHHRQRDGVTRSEEHTSELQSPCNLVCRLL